MTVRNNVLRIAPLIALCVAAGCVVIFVVGYLVLLLSFRGVSAALARLTTRLLPRDDRTFILISRADLDIDP